MFPFKARIDFDRDSHKALYVQLSNQIIALIKQQTLAPRTRLPSSRALAEELGIHRKTVVACYEELMLQGWIESIPKKGTYVLESMPLLVRQKISESEAISLTNSPGYSFFKNHDLVERPFYEKKKDVIFLLYFLAMSIRRLNQSSKK